MKWLYVYDFTPSQIPAEIGSIGITMQYANYYTLNHPVYPIRRFPYTAEANQYAYKGQTGYTISNAGIVTIYNPLENTKRTVDISGITGTNNTLSIGVSGEDERIYVSVYSSAAASRRMYEFADDSFGAPIRTFSPSNMTNTSGNKVFAVYGNYCFYYNSGWFRGDFVNNINAALQTMPDCPYAGTPLSGNTGSIIVKNGYVFQFYDYYSQTTARVPIWDMAENKQVGTICANTKTAASSVNQQCVEDPVALNKPFLLSSLSGAFYYRNALTCYAVGDGFPARPPGSCVQIRYLIEVGY
jgi:hypothetical protein